MFSQATVFDRIEAENDVLVANTGLVELFLKYQVGVIHLEHAGSFHAWIRSPVVDFFQFQQNICEHLAKRYYSVPRTRAPSVLLLAYTDSIVR
jgi:hypothetical protein